jgi:hypothetical protein
MDLSANQENPPMITFLCGLTPAQWGFVNIHEPTGTTQTKPEGYRRAGLYEGKDTFWLIQYAAHVYRYWNYGDVIDPPVNGQEREELLEVALQSIEEAAHLREHAEQLLDEAARLEQIASESFNSAFIGDP